MGYLMGLLMIYGGTQSAGWAAFKACRRVRGRGVGYRRAVMLQHCTLSTIATQTDVNKRRMYPILWHTGSVQGPVPIEWDCCTVVGVGPQKFEGCSLRVSVSVAAPHDAKAPQHSTLHCSSQHHTTPHHTTPHHAMPRHATPHHTTPHHTTPHHTTPHHTTPHHTTPHHTTPHHTAVSVDRHSPGGGGALPISSGVHGAQMPGAPAQGTPLLLPRYGGDSASGATPGPAHPPQGAPWGHGPPGAPRPGDRPPASVGP